jgi:hypothetical protein
MRTVTVTLRAVDLSVEMAAMREWLDRRRYEPSRFTCDQEGNAVVVCIDFTADEEAEAFAKRFVAQNQTQRPPPFLLRSIGVNERGRPPEP